MQTGKKTLVWLVPALLVFAAGFAAATVFDLPIDLALYSPQNIPAILVEVLCWYPAFLPTLFGLMLVCTRPKPLRKPWLSAGSAVVCLGGFAAVFYMSYHYLTKRGWLTGFAQPATWLWLAAGILLIALLFAAALRLPTAKRPGWEFAMWWATVLTAANQALVYSLKTLWQRTRFDDMMAAGNLDLFTPWYRPLGNGGSSFPSGHTANAACIFVLIFICDAFAATKKQRIASYVASWAYIGFTAIERIIIGRHFLSDTLAAAGLMALVVLVIRRTKWYKKWLLKVRA